MNRRLPAEWEPVDTVLLTWPHAHGDWGKTLRDVQDNFLRLARAINPHARLVISANDEADAASISDLLNNAECDMRRIDIYTVPSNDIWVRDHGPITIDIDGRPQLLDFVFNGWGGKYAADLDNQVTRRLLAQGAFADMPCDSIDFVLEGGSLETDGRGTLLTTRQCLLAPTRNPGLDEAAIEARLRDALGVERVLWLSHGDIVGDDTDGHIDMLARFTDPETLVYMICDDPADPHYAPLQAMQEELRAFTTAGGEPYRLVSLPLPTRIDNADGERLPASYANFLILNGVVLLPVYGVAEDAEAITRLQDCFLHHEVVAVDCRALINQFGSLHCATRQIIA
ncbi:MAG: agmatine deiminase family protein [Granulosicoccaceae bacterium]|jgi:agmatine/peptidylarginine deiminase